MSAERTVSVDRAVLSIEVIFRQSLRIANERRSGPDSDREKRGRTKKDWEQERNSDSNGIDKADTENLPEAVQSSGDSKN